MYDRNGALERKCLPDTKWQIDNTEGCFHNYHPRRKRGSCTRATCVAIAAAVEADGIARAASPTSSSFTFEFRSQLE